MTAETLDCLLTVLRKHGIASAEIPVVNGSPLRVVFGPEASPLPVGDETTPGGWKSSQRLDADPLDDERSVP